MIPNLLIRPIAFAALCGTLIASAHAVTPADLLAGYNLQAGTTGAASRGQQFFTSTHGREWSCASCHGTSPTTRGKHASTGKVIEPLAPAFHAQRFTDTAQTEKWFRRNCNDVVGRECTPGEKADVLAFLIALRP